VTCLIVFAGHIVVYTYTHTHTHIQLAILQSLHETAEKGRPGQEWNIVQVSMHVCLCMRMHVCVYV
jgi:hypothetical protein